MWKRIDTAPRYGTTVIVYAAPDVLAAKNVDGRWLALGCGDIEEIEPTYWQPLPQPPYGE